MTLTMVDLFCGAGGANVGTHLALEELGIPSAEVQAHAVNHWDLAVAVHGLNMPWIPVHQEDITKVSAKTSGGGTAQSPALPLHTITTIARHGLVTVDIDGETYAVADIGLRMLEPRELALAMGFPTWYRWERADGTPLTKRDAVRMIGNACPVSTVKELVKAAVLQRPLIFGLEAA